MVNDKKHYILCATGTNNTPAIHLQHYIIGCLSSLGFYEIFQIFKNFNKDCALAIYSLHKTSQIASNSNFIKDISQNLEVET